VLSWGPTPEMAAAYTEHEDRKNQSSRSTYSGILQGEKHWPNGTMILHNMNHP
jgi:hypothetical protein